MFNQIAPIAAQLRFKAAPHPALAAVQTNVDLSALLNKYLKVGMALNLGGKNAWISGVFSGGTLDSGKGVYGDPDAFVSLLIDGEASAHAYKAMDLLTSPPTLNVGSGQYKIKLSPDITDTYASEIVVVDLSNNHKDRITLRDLLAKVNQAGAAFRIQGQNYTLFYYDAPSGGKVFAIRSDADGSPKVFLIPEASVPSGRSAAFQTLEGHAFGLSRSGNQLQILAQQ
jgi:hypothetical protein